MPLILIVDDEAAIRKALRINLEARGYETIEVDDGRAAVRMAADRNPDLMLLDLGLPDLDGLDVIAAVRGWSRLPIIALTVRNEETSKVDALDAGADDYVTKPFGINELLARIRSALRRSGEADDNLPVISTDDFVIYLVDRKVRTSNGDAARLTPLEWSIVEHLTKHPNRLVTHRMLVTAVWGPTYEPDASLLRVHMNHIRAKLEPDPQRPVYFVTESGMGYRFLPGSADGN